jgi:hypothetical protein
VDAKLELQKSIQKEVDDLKLRHDRQLGELERNKRRIMSDIIDTSEKKIIKLDHENHQLHTNLESLHRLSAEKAQTISEIEKKLRRELLNIEVQGTSKIDWLKEQSTPSDILRHFKMQERKIEQLRYKLNQTEEEVAFENRQTVHSENISKELQRELHDEELRHQRLEAVKDDLEKRLTDRVEQLERDLNSKNSQLEAEFSTLQLQLEASITDKDDLISVLQQEIEEISQLVRDSKLNTQKLSGKLVDRLDTDRNKFTELEKEKRDASVQLRKAKKELEEEKQRAVEAEENAQKNKKQYFTLLQEIETLQANQQKLEKVERRILTRI